MSELYSQLNKITLEGSQPKVLYSTDNNKTTFINNITVNNPTTNPVKVEVLIYDELKTNNDFKPQNGWVVVTHGADNTFQSPYVASEGNTPATIVNYSTDLSNWQVAGYLEFNETIDGGYNNSFNNRPPTIVYNGNTYVCIQLNWDYFYTSTDLVTWTYQSLNIDGLGYSHDQWHVLTANNKTIIVGNWWWTN